MEQNRNTKVVLHKWTTEFLQRCVETIEKRKNNLSKISVKTIGHLFARKKKETQPIVLSIAINSRWIMDLNVIVLVF